MKKWLQVTVNSLFVLWLCAVSHHALAEKNQDFQAWNNFTLLGSMNNKALYWLETQQRLGLNVSTLSQLLFRSAMGIKWGERSSFWLGYAWIDTSRPFAARVTQEHRMWEQFLWIKNYHQIRLISRTRLEQRFIEGMSKTGWRARQFVRLQWSFLNDKPYFISANEEVFWRINNTLRGADNSGFDQNRLFVGIGTYPNARWLIEIGYQNQLIHQLETKNFIGHSVVFNILGALW